MSRDPGDIQAGPPDDRDRRDRDEDRPRRRGPDRDDPFDVGRHDIDIRKRSGPDPADLTAGDWALCVLCPGIACILGVIRAVSGNPSGGKMIGIAILFAVLWNIIRFVLLSAQQ